ncbi:hypothetical protein Tco_1556343, partial [Tanacetum coccineum]
IVVRVEESGAVVVEIVAFVVFGVGISVDYRGRGKNGGIGGGMDVDGADEVLGIIVIST